MVTFLLIAGLLNRSGLPILKFLSNIISIEVMKITVERVDGAAVQDLNINIGKEHCPSPTEIAQTRDDIFITLFAPVLLPGTAQVHTDQMPSSYISLLKVS
jgi:hypothetical protein